MWAYDYPNNVRNVNLKEEFLSNNIESITGKAWPTPFYETIMCGLLFIFLWGIRKKNSTPGILFCIYLIACGTERFLIEQIRINNKYHFLGINPTQAEIISTIIILCGVGGLWYLIKNKKR
jgi:prolipoprotein diacylglyceryltransferase